MLIKRRREYILNNQGYYIIYLRSETAGQEIEIGRTYWSDFFSLLGADNSYEDGLLAGLKFVYSDIEFLDV